MPTGLRRRLPSSLRAEVASTRDRHQLELAVIGLDVGVEHPLASEDLRVLHDHVEQVIEQVHRAVDHRLEIELDVDDVALDEPLEHRARVDQLIAIDRAEPGDPADPLAITVAGLEARRAQADAERIEEQIACGSPCCCARSRAARHRSSTELARGDHRGRCARAPPARHRARTTCPDRSRCRSAACPSRPRSACLDARMPFATSANVPSPPM